MKSAMVAVAGVSSLMGMGVGAWLGYGTLFPPHRPPADNGSTQSEGGAPFDAGSCNANDKTRACDCCFTMANEIRCTVGVAPPDAEVLTMPRCRGGK